MSGKRTWLGSCLCVVLLCITSIVQIGCNNCDEENKDKCDASCTRQANCTITYSYNEGGSRIKLKRVCKWLSSEGTDTSNCAKCTDLVKDSKDRVISQNCVVCNVCNSEFECLDGKGESGVDGNGDCKDSAPYCRQGVCSSCKSDSDCSDPRKPVCTDQGCACTDGQCGCTDDKDCTADKNKPVCNDKNECATCQCSNLQPKRPFCLKQTDGSVKCVACVEENDCLDSATPYCDTKTNTCLACGKDADCKDSSKPRCDTKTNACVTCAEDTDCKDSLKPQCNAGTCVSCRCPQIDKDKPVCIKNSDDTVTCVGCLKDGDCAGTSTPKCNTKTNTCEAACKVDTDCPNPQLCSSGECVLCRDRNDCKDPNAPRCVTGVCRCVTNTDCLGSLPICSRTTNKCSECSSDADCPGTFPTCSTSGVCELRACDPANGGKECSAPTHSQCRKIGRSYRCVGCAGDSECKATERCDLSKFVCVTK